jgi:hypothetical protein
MWLQDKECKMRIVDEDIQLYTASMEFAQDGLYRCHPNDEARFKKLIKKYESVLNALEDLKQTLDHYR